jgi:hypothetical protein
MEQIMKRMAYVGFAATILLGTLASVSTAQTSGGQLPPSQVTSNPGTGAQEQPLGDYARAVRKDKKAPAAKQFDNDNLPTSDKVSVVGGEPASGDNQATSQAGDNSQAGNAGQDADKAEKKPPQITPGESEEDRQRVYAEWQDKIAKQKEQVDLLARELDVSQREYKLRAAAMYGDVGNRMRNEAAWDKEDRDYKDKIAEKQKALDDAKQQMEDMQEEARKSGVPNSVREKAAQGTSEQEKEQ